MFDVSDFAHPTLNAATCRSSAEHGWGWSEALYEHKAFQYWAPKELLAIPQSNYDYATDTYRYLSNSMLVKVDPTQRALSLKGRIDHCPYYDAEPTVVALRRHPPQHLHGRLLYAISDKAITVHRE